MLRYPSAALSTMRLCRRGSMRYVLLSVCVLCLVLYVYFSSGGSAGFGFPRAAHKSPGAEPLSSDGLVHSSAVDVTEMNDEEPPPTHAECPALSEAGVDISTPKVYATLEFNPRFKEFWEDNFERRYVKRRSKWNKLPLKVFVVPHSHNDPGWLRTFENYFHSQTSNILNNMVDKLTKHQNMTFIWSEISLFAKWWEGAHPQKREAIKDLLRSGRFEIVTGGWVMTDEASVNLYAMLEQMVEGHQWVQTHLNYVPKSAWSVDPFGHGATLPYLLHRSGLENMVIQRIHFGWKQYLAEQQSGDFRWRQMWDTTGDTDILCHNSPFDIYSIKHSCGPQTQICLTFDFRKIKGEYTEYTQRSQPITQWNLKERSETLLAQYGRTASLFPHNVALIPLGDDFRYDHDIEWDQQYKNYQMMFDYINSNKDLHAEVRFGTVSDYFDAVRERTGSLTNLPKLAGDFFVYSDVFIEGHPAYWSGYYTTRPYWKALCRELEASLRSSEILYSFALAKARHEGLNRTTQILERDYEGLTLARANLGVFQHHDAITGTSRSHVMHDYGLKLFAGIQASAEVITHAVQHLVTEKPAETELENEKKVKHLPTFLAFPHERQGFQVLPQKLPIFIPPTQEVKVIVFNSLAQAHQEPVQVVVTHTNIRVFDADGRAVPYQLGPVWNASAGPFQMVRDQYELMFLADLPALSLVTYSIRRVEVRDSSTIASVTLYNGGLGVDDQDPVFPIQKEQMAADDLRLENPHLRATFSRETGLLQSVMMRSSGRISRIKMVFRAYVSAQYHSGAYLFMPEPRQPQRNISDNAPYFSILRGAVASEVTILYPDFLLHTVRVYHTSGMLGKGLHMDNYVEFPVPPRFRDTELYMRLETDINSENTFYTDLNAFQMMRRVVIPKIGVEGNYYPITSQAYIQDSNVRLSLLTSHSQGGTSWQSGWLEVMLDRRSLYDDSRGMGEGVLDNKRTATHFWLLLEERAAKQGEGYSRPTLLANRLGNSLNYPAGVLVVDSRTSPQLRRKVQLLSRSLPCDFHMVTLRVLPVKSYFEFPSRSSLLLIQNQGYSCDFPAELHNCSLTAGTLSRGIRFKEVHVGVVHKTSLTAMQTIQTLDSISEISIPPMEIGAYNVTFA